MGKIEALVRLRRSSRHLAPKGEAGTAREHSARDSAAGSLRIHSFDPCCRRRSSTAPTVVVRVEGDAQSSPMPRHHLDLSHPPS